MTAATDEFTAEQYAAAARFGLTLDQIAEADAEIADLEHMNTIGYHPGHFENKSWAHAILQSEAPIEAANEVPTGPPVSYGQRPPLEEPAGPPVSYGQRPPLEEPAGPPVSYGQRPPQTEPPMKMQKAEESLEAAPPWKEQPAQEPPRKMMRMQLPQPPAPPWREVRCFATENAHSAGAGHHV